MRQRLDAGARRSVTVEYAAVVSVDGCMEAYMLMEFTRRVHAGLTVVS